MAANDSFNWVPELQGNEDYLGIWPVFNNTRDALFPNYALFASIYTHFVDFAQPDNEYHTLAHDVVFTMTLSKALRRTLTELNDPFTESNHPEYPCWHRIGNPSNVLPGDDWVHQVIGSHCDWFLLFKVFPEIFEGEGKDEGCGGGGSGCRDGSSLIVSTNKSSGLAQCCHFACDSGELRMVMFLLSLRTKNDDGVTPIVDVNTLIYDGTSCGKCFLSTASQSGHASVVQYLISSGASFLADVDSECLFPIHHAFDNADTEVLSELLKASDCDVNLKTQRSDFALHFAARAGRIGAIKMLIDAGCNVDAVNNVGNTPLHFWSGRTDVIEALLKCGASVNIKNSFGYTALDMATGLGKARLAAAGGKSGH